ncbi:hypothetical protein GCM10010329_61630 [Streptomyces spiroverticillatus]|uniref:OmpR/PhoB-type domain-containing protein n=1 Tax=Streptomyces finlayi TaxID=67296 RepID=A0A918X6D5_9ACTN|nr:AfsR/SARP family transcriptional regulator [Streptomyces finlayi]GHA30122.1 hypothetical protein GCM10010329_61630 [Streptomyces spiroverticillatus]GHD15091.1 hypothetical protein GCM10010334_74820 [Streptomyces finlayi]
MSSVEVHFALLDGVEAYRGEAKLALGPPQRRAVLCALVLRRRQWVSAQALLEALYEEAIPASGIGVIQTHVAALRRVLEPGRRPRTPATILLSGHGGYQLKIDDAQTDLGVLDRLTAEAELARSRADLRAADRLYANALGLFGGEPLAGIPGPYAARWRGALAERRLTLRENALDVMIAHGHPDRAADQLRTLVVEHPLRERLYALLMRALYQHGCQSEALDVYSRARRILVDHLGIDPSHELRALHALVLSGEPATPPAEGSWEQTLPSLRGGSRLGQGTARAGEPTESGLAEDSTGAAGPGTDDAWTISTPTGGAEGIAPPAASAPAPTDAWTTAPHRPIAGRQGPLIGRDSALAQILVLAENAAAGAGGLAVVSSAPGHGKSRFLDELALRLPHVRRIHIHAHPATHDEHPLGFVEEVLARLGAASAGISTCTDHAIAELVCGAPGTDGHPTVILVDDASPSGERASRLLSVLARRLRTSRVLLVVTVNEQPWDPGAAAWHSAVEGAATALLRLGALDATAVTALCAAAAGADRAPSLAGQVLRATAGIPLLVVALLTDLATLPASARLPSRMPGGRYSRALAQQLGRYSAEGARMLRALAVLSDGPVTVEILAAACDEPVTTVRDRCELLASVGVLDRADPPALPHPLVTQVLRRLTDPQESAAMCVAAAGQAKVQGQDARQAARYLRELTGAQWSSWTVVLLDAADACLRLNLISEARDHVRAALRIVAPSARDAVLLRLGQLETLVNPAAAPARFEEALALQRARGAVPTALIPLAWALTAQYRGEEAIVLMDEVVAETARRDPATASALRAASWTVAALTQETWSVFVRRLRAEHRDGPASKDPAADAVLAWADAFEVRCSAQQALARFPAAEARGQGAGRGWGQLPTELSGILAHLAVWSENLCLAWELCAQRDDRYFGAADVFRLVLRAEVLLRRGEYGHALRECALVASAAPQHPASRPAALVAQYAHALLGLGRTDEADRLLADAADQADPRSWELTVVKFVQGMVCSARDDARQAVAHFLDCGRRVASWRLDNPGYIPWRSYAALDLVRLGEFDRARELAAAELALARRWNTPRTLGLAWRAVALAASDERTLPLLERAVEHLRASEARVEFVPALLDLALARAGAGDRQGACELLEEARAFAASQGADLYSGRIDAHLERLWGELTSG